MLFPGAVKGANDRVSIAHIGLGAMGSGNLHFASNTGFQVTALCDVYQTTLERARRRPASWGMSPSS